MADLMVNKVKMNKRKKISKDEYINALEKALDKMTDEHVTLVFKYKNLLRKFYVRTYYKKTKFFKKIYIWFTGGKKISDA